MTYIWGSSFPKKQRARNKSASRAIKANDGIFPKKDLTAEAQGNLCWVQESEKKTSCGISETEMLCGNTAFAGLALEVSLKKMHKARTVVALDYYERQIDKNKY